MKIFDEVGVIMSLIVLTTTCLLGFNAIREGRDEANGMTSKEMMAVREYCFEKGYDWTVQTNNHNNKRVICKQYGNQ